MKIATILIIQLIASTALADDWPQWRGLRRDGVWRESGVVKEFDKPKLEHKWRTAIGPGYAGPAVACGRVFVTDRQKESKTERVLCLDQATGKLLWKHEYPCVYRGVDYPSGPRATPSISDGKVYSVGTMGHLFCLDVRDGKPIWSKDYVKDYATEIPTWGIAGSPLIDGEQLIVLVGGAKGAAVVSFNKDTGKEIWRALSASNVGYSSPVIIEAGGTRQLILWLPEQIVSLDPKTGKQYWEQPFHSNMGNCIVTPVFDGRRLFVSTFFNGPIMLRLALDQPKAEVMWRGTSESEINTDKVHCLMASPIMKDGYLYAVDSYGALRCLDAETGTRIWETYRATGHDRWWSAFLISQDDRAFLANEQGELIIARLNPKEYEEISRAKLIEPTSKVGRRVLVWSHPAFADKHVFARNDREIVCASLAAPTGSQPSR